jgi:hypothetical protein
MPSYPTAPLVNFAQSVYATLAPAQATFLQTRITAWRNASTAQAGATAVLGTLGNRMGSGTMSLARARNWQAHLFTPAEANIPQ